MDRANFEQLKDQLKTNGVLKIKIISGSMSPIIKTNQNIIIKRSEREDLKRFDIIVFYQKKKLNCHYVHSLNTLINSDIVTRNLNGYFDLPVPEQDLLGICISHKINFWRKIRL